jgi:thiol:disulfide interchange protein DsbD
MRFLKPAIRRLALLLCLLPGMAFGAVSNLAVSARDTVSLVSQSNVTQSGHVTLGLHFILQPGWHIYWSNPGDAGLAPHVTLQPPAQAGALQFPPPSLDAQDGIAAYVLSGDVLLPFTATQVGGQITADATWLVCSNVCVPEHARFTLSLAGGASAQAALFGPSAIIASPFAATIAPDGTLSLAGPTVEQVAAARFFPDQPSEIVNRAPQSLGFTRAGMTLRLTPAPGFTPGRNLAGILELTDPAGTMQALAVSAAPGPGVSAGTGLAAWLGLALLGGLLLNLMPCVFPILAMKALSLLRLGGQARRAVRVEALLYTAGVLTAMLLLGGLLLAARAAGAAIGWGFQLQSPVVVAVLGWLMFALALNLAGAFEIAGFARLGGRLAGGGSFFTGLLAVVVATPCTAPFMGGAVAAALSLPPVAGIGIFLALGLGLAAPFLLIALWPHLASLLPRPGAWMLALQRLLSLPMFATFLWLAWVLFRQAGGFGLGLMLAGAVLLGIGLVRPRLRAVVLICLLLLPLVRTAPAATPISLPGAQAFTAGRLASLRAARQPVLVDITAAWCVVCLVNDRTTLDTAPVRAALRAAHVQLLVGDWTSRDPALTQYLRQNQRAGVPLYVLYPPGGAPVTLPQLLTPGLLTGALQAVPRA